MTQGLTKSEVKASRERYGTNVLERQKQKGFASIFFGQFTDPIIRILIGALIINAILCFKAFEWYESLGILSSMLISVTISAISESRGGKAFEKLQKESAGVRCRVLRDGEAQEIAASELVVGDAVIAEAGEQIQADGFLSDGEIRVNQSALNGESREITKTAGSISRNPELNDQNSLYRGAVIMGGSGIMCVTAVGKATMYGELARELQQGAPDSPLKRRLAALARTVARIGYIAAAVVGLADLFYSLVIANGFHKLAILAAVTNPEILIARLLHALTLAVTIVVVAAPEGLPMMISVVLSANMRRMFRTGVLVRKPAGIETAGSMGMLFTDKTGTLTTGKMSVEVIGTGTGERMIPNAIPQGTFRTAFLRGCLLNSQCVTGRDGYLGGNATERALAEACVPYREELGQRESFEPFDSAKKYSVAVVTDGKHRYTLMKGAPELLIPRCRNAYGTDGIHPLSPGRIRELQKNFLESGMRCIALCESIDSGAMTLVAIAGLRDPLRSDAAESVRTLRNAGVRVVMVTGDSIETAKRIASETGIADAEGIVLESDRLAHMNDSQVLGILDRLCVVARARPTDKSRLVRLAQKAGYICGMTGDGVNDAPALKIADVGFSMGSGTEVAREAGDIVILDDSLASVTRAVLYGRTIFRSIRKFIIFQLTINLCAVGVSVLGPILGVANPITVIQMLWVNLIMDTLAGLAFAGEPPRMEYLTEPPVSRNEPLFNKEGARRVIMVGTFILSLLLYFLRSGVTRRIFGFHTRPLEFLTVFFVLFIFCAVACAFNARTTRANLFADIAKNPAFVAIMTLVAITQLAMIYIGGKIFRTVPLDPQEILFCIAVSFSVIVFGIAEKLDTLRYRRLQHGTYFSCKKKKDMV